LFENCLTILMVVNTINTNTSLEELQSQSTQTPH
jgi:hypothetical protein